MAIENNSFYFNRTERVSYRARRAMAIDKPDDFVSIISDGMDQSKTNIPHFEGWNLPKVQEQTNLCKFLRIKDDYKETLSNVGH